MHANIKGVERIKQDEMALLTLVDRSVELKDQLRDYKYRGEELETMNFLDFMLETYEVTSETKDSQIIVEATSDEIPHTRGPGRPPSARIAYHDDAGKGKRCRIIRQPGHETLPRFVGKWFCRSDNDFEKDFFRASMLMLLKPWRKLHALKGDMETFKNAFETFMLQADEKCKRVVANVEYYYECSDGAKADRMKAQTNGRMNPSEQEDFNGGNIDSLDDEVEFTDGHMTILLEDITEDEIERAYTIRLLRSFDPNLFQNHPSPEALRQDMRRLERLNKKTKTDWQTRHGQRAQSRT
jgi:hypothetical protein